MYFIYCYMKRPGFLVELKNNHLFVYILVIFIYSHISIFYVKPSLSFIIKKLIGFSIFLSFIVYFYFDTESYKFQTIIKFFENVHFFSFKNVQHLSCAFLNHSHYMTITLVDNLIHFPMEYKEYEPNYY